MATFGWSGPRAFSQTNAVGEAVAGRSGPDRRSRAGLGVRHFEVATPRTTDGAQLVRGVALAVLLGTPDVAIAPFANFDPTYRVTINVQRFDLVQGDSVFVEAVWAVRKTTGGDTHSGRTVAREAVHGDGFEALAAAHSRALAKLSADIAAAIRAAPGAR